MGESDGKLHELLARKAIWLLSIFIIVCLTVLWAVFSRLEVVVTAQGSIVPAAAVKTLQNLEGGILESLFVRPGDTVIIGQKVAQIDATQYESDMRSLKIQVLALSLRRERLMAELHGARFTPDLAKYAAVPELLIGERAEFESRARRISGAKDTINLAETELSIISRLASKNVEPKSEVIRASIELEEKRLILNQINEQLSAELNRVQGELQTKEEAILALSNKLERATVRSPTNGVVGELFVKTEGAVIAPGLPIMEIIPTEERLIVEARIPASDIAHLEPGMPAIIKLSAYDFSMYGSVPGVVKYLSPDISKDQSVGAPPSQNTFVLRVEATAPNRNIELRPGLEATIDVVTGERSIAEYMIAPLKRSMDNTFKGG